MTASIINLHMFNIMGSSIQGLHYHFIHEVNSLLLLYTNLIASENVILMNI